MSNNPVARIRTIGSALLILVALMAIGASVASIGPSGLVWAAIISTVAIGFAILSFFANLRHPDASEAAWDEQNTESHRASLIFGFWATLAAFLIFLALVLMERMDPAMAFFWLGPVIGVVPPAHFLFSVARGRAE